MRTLAINGGQPAVSGEHRRWPEVTDVDRRCIGEVLDRGVLCGATAPEITALQEEWAEYCGTRFCLALNTGTAALHCAAVGIGLEPGDEVVVPALTFVATAFGMAHHGAVPVFCDIQEDTYNIDPERIEERITERTKAIVPVHLHGLPADMEEIRSIARKHDLAVVEDAAQAHGATYRGRRTGSLGDVAIFSTNATKNLAGGEGGFLNTDNEEIFSIARHLAIFGEDVSALRPGEYRSYRSKGLGWNYRSSELPAALTRAQLSRLDAYTETAQRNGEILTRGLGEIRGLVPPLVPSDRTSVYHKYRVRIDGAGVGFTGKPTELRDRVLSALRAEGVDAVLWQTEPMPSYPAFRRPLVPWTPASDEVDLADWDPSEYPVASKILDSSIVLGSESQPPYVQTPEIMHQYVEACAKVMGELDGVLSAPYKAPVLR